MATNTPALLFLFHEASEALLSMLSEKYVKLLLVEDSKILAERLADALTEAIDCHLVTVADSEAEAIAIAKRERVDVIVLDLHLKQGTGFGVLRALANENRPLKIIVLTNHDLPEYKTAALALGATYFLDKAHDYARLPAVLREIVGSQSTH
jgi:two-component system OmpR family response regulator